MRPLVQTTQEDPMRSWCTALVPVVAVPGKTISRTESPELLPW